jgi:hypothetical protein
LNLFYLFNLYFKWGHSTSDEMCFNFMYYYPKQPLGSECLSVFPLAELLKFYSSLIRQEMELFFKSKRNLFIQKIEMD